MTRPVERRPFIYPETKIDSLLAPTETDSIKRLLRARADVDANQFSQAAHRSRWPFRIGRTRWLENSRRRHTRWPYWWPCCRSRCPRHPISPTLTGEKFVRDMLAAPDNGAASMRRERAMGYMDGVMDGTAGLLWCPAGQHVGHELNYLAAEQMKSLPAEQLKKGAAPLVVAALAKIYPCPIKRRPS